MLGNAPQVFHSSSHQKKICKVDQNNGTMRHTRLMRLMLQGGSALVHLADCLSELCPVHDQLFQLSNTVFED